MREVGIGLADYTLQRITTDLARQAEDESDRRVLALADGHPVRFGPRTVASWPKPHSNRFKPLPSELDPETRSRCNSTR
jgi:hypothetical protein